LTGTFFASKLAGEYRGLFGRFRIGIQVRQYPGLFAQR
jgi:hypothetical protein